MFEDNIAYNGAGGYAVGQYAPGHNPQYQQRMNYFNIARNLFPFSGGTDAKAIPVASVIKAAKEIEAFLNGETN